MTLKAANEVQIPLTISNIDKRVPTGRLIYGQPENGKVKVYVEHDADSWIEEPQNVQKDAEGEYIEFTSNGMIQITLKNDVGNITTLIAEVYVLDTEPPVITSSRWLTQTAYFSWSSENPPPVRPDLHKYLPMYRPDTRKRGLL